MIALNNLEHTIIKLSKSPDKSDFFVVPVKKSGKLFIPYPIKKILKKNRFCYSFLNPYGNKINFAQGMHCI